MSRVNSDLIGSYMDHGVTAVQYNMYQFANMFSSVQCDVNEAV